jgi:undecaprenyl diphosphate synthase
MKVPESVAIIMDGNGRWAKSKGKPRTYGHKVGAENVEKVCRAADKLGIKYLTIYAFSTENWNRPENEVNTLMTLLNTYLNKCIKTCKRDNMSFKIIGDRNGLSKELNDTIKKLEDVSSVYTGLKLIIAINYGSRDEILRAVKKTVKYFNNSDRDIGSLDDDTFAGFLDTAGVPDPDLMIRTSGEERLSNFLLWQLSYSEFYFTDCPWPEFGEKELTEAIIDYDNRHRRFGGVEEQNV